MIARLALLLALVGVLAGARTDSCHIGTIGLSLGDSIMTVPGRATNFPYLYSVTSDHTALSQEAVGGYVTSEILLSWTDARSMTPLDLVIVDGGINDCFPSSSPANAAARAAAALANLQTIFTQADADGHRVISVNLTPVGGYSGWSADSETCRGIMNAALPSATGVDCYFNAAAVVADPGTPTILNPIYDSGDHAHQNAAGSVALAAGILASCGAY